MKDKKGFTLIELLAVIVVLGIIMLIAVTSVSGVIEKSKRDAFVDTARAYINAVRQKVMTENIALPTDDYDDIRIYLDKTMVEKGGITSPYNRAYTILDNAPVTQDDYDDIDDLNDTRSTIVSFVEIQCQKNGGDTCQYEYRIFLSDGDKATVGDDCWSGLEGVIATPESFLDASSIYTITGMANCQR